MRLFINDKDFYQLILLFMLHYDITSIIGKLFVLQISVIINI